MYADEIFERSSSERLHPSHTLHLLPDVKSEEQTPMCFSQPAVNNIREVLMGWREKSVSRLDMF